MVRHLLIASGTLTDLGLGASTSSIVDCTVQHTLECQGAQSQTPNFKLDNSSFLGMVTLSLMTRRSLDTCVPGDTRCTTITYVLELMYHNALLTRISVVPCAISARERRCSRSLLSCLQPGTYLVQTQTPKKCRADFMM